MTYNLWKTNGVPTAWKMREPVLKRQLEALHPDVMFVQELHPNIAKVPVFYPGSQNFLRGSDPRHHPRYAREFSIF
eukprot:1525063-Karenia_brevis.AAC.1